MPQGDADVSLVLFLHLLEELFQYNEERSVSCRFVSESLRLSATGERAVTYPVAASVAQARLLVSPALERKDRGRRPTGRPWLGEAGERRGSRRADERRAKREVKGMLCYS